jgi:hypothetical protein
LIARTLFFFAPYQKKKKNESKYKKNLLMAQKLFLPFIAAPIHSVDDRTEIDYPHPSQP